MNILWFTWKDTGHPLAGGAEVVNEELAKRLVKDGHTVHFIVGGYCGCEQEATHDGFQITRLGNRYTLYFKAYLYYKKHLECEQIDLVIDEVNTIPFFAKFYAKQKNILFVHQLARQIWFYQMPFPLSLLGYLLEPLYLWLLSDREVITVSESTKRDLMRYGFKAEKIHIISEGIQIEPVGVLASIRKYEQPTILSLGAVRPMKRTLDIVRAFEKLKYDKPSAQLIIVGDMFGMYGARVRRAVERSLFAKDIKVLGSVSQEKKIELMQKSHVIAVTSVKEGWGLIVTEAASQGTPAVVYNVDGLRDSVRDGDTGVATKENTPASLAKALVEILSNPADYEAVRTKAWQWSKNVSFEKSYEQFRKIIIKYA